MRSHVDNGRTSAKVLRGVNGVRHNTFQFAFKARSLL